MRHNRAGSWVGFGAWTGVGLLFFGGAFLFPLLVVTWPLAAVSTWLLVRRGVRAPDLIGLVNGIAALCLFIAFTQRNSNPCGDVTTLVLRPGETDAGCSGADPRPFLIFGLVLAVICVLAYAVTRHTQRVHRVG
jgi:hypothetical protein